jgi:hypothetical protein
MQEENEHDNSQSVEEVPEVQEEVVEVIENQDEVLAKNRTLYERAKRAEAKLKEYEARLPETESYQGVEEEDMMAKVKALEAKLNSFEEKNQFEALYQQYPILKDKTTEFQEYREANQGMSLQTSAKAYLVEHDLLGQETKRKGLEKAGGGQRTPPTGKMSVEDTKRLRENNYAEYKKLLMDGKIQF